MEFNVEQFTENIFTKIEYIVYMYMHVVSVWWGWGGGGAGISHIQSGYSVSAFLDKT